MWPALKRVLLVIGAALALILDAMKEKRQAKRREELRTEHEKIDKDSAAWMREHFSGLRGSSDIDGDELPDETSADDSPE